MEEEMRVLSLFDGISCGLVALERSGIAVSEYRASEICKSSIKVSNNNHREIKQLGDVTKLDFDGSYVPDLLLAGTPCQDFSVARVSMGTKTITGLEGKKSSLFYHALRAKNTLKPRWFLFENVKMKKESKEQLDNYLGVEGIKINSNLVSFQNRERYYWTNIPFLIPKDSGINFQNFIGIGDTKEAKTNKTPSRIRMWNDGRGRTHEGACVNITKSEKIGCLTTKQDRCPNSGLIAHEDFCRYLTRSEQELAQTLPIGYTNGVSFHAAQQVIGNGWTVDVISHILKGIK